MRSYLWPEQVRHSAPVNGSGIIQVHRLKVRPFTITWWNSLFSLMVRIPAKSKNRATSKLDVNTSNRYDAAWQAQEYCLVSQAISSTILMQNFIPAVTQVTHTPKGAKAGKPRHIDCGDSRILHSIWNNFMVAWWQKTDEMTKIFFSTEAVDSIMLLKDLSS